MWRKVKKTKNVNEQKIILLIEKIKEMKQSFWSLTTKEKIKIMNEILNENYEIYQRREEGILCIYDTLSDEWIPEIDGTLDVFMNTLIIESTLKNT